MIADSSALPEQVIRDVVRSAFDSAGQRCSAARLFFVQEDVAKAMIDMLVGAVEALDIGDPLNYATDIGPVIDDDAEARLEAHKLRMRKEARELVDLPLPDACAERQLRHASGLRDRRCRRPRGGGVRPDSACGALLGAAISTR